jgi:NitT/TauT family transport system substrate-binding protein
MQTPANFTYGERTMKSTMTTGLLLLMVCLMGCPNVNSDVDTTEEAGGQATPTFRLAWSEYPSWSVFGVADMNKIIDKDEGEMGPVEKKWNVDIVLDETDYDTCITMYGSSTVDAVCITNMDILAASLSRDSVAILPTSTSDGADAVIVTGIDSVDDLSSVESYGLEKSVSQYMFERNLEEMGKDPANFVFKNMDPAAAAQAMQTKQENIRSIVVWNPFVLQTLRTRDGSKILFDSKTIPGEIIDMVVIAKASLEKDGGEDFACAVIEAFYEVNKLLADSEKGDETLVALGEKFSSLPLEDMKIVVEQTKFYKSADKALELFGSETFRSETMPKVVDFCATHDIVDSKPIVGFDSATAQLNFDTQYIKKVQSQPSADFP